MTTKTKPSTTDSLIQMLQEQIQTNQKQSLIIDGLTQEIKLLREQIAYLTNKMYGRSKESLPEQVSGQLSLGLFEEPEIFEGLETEETLTVRSHPRKKGRRPIKSRTSRRKKSIMSCQKRHSIARNVAQKWLILGQKKYVKKSNFIKRALILYSTSNTVIVVNPANKRAKVSLKKGLSLNW